MANNNGITIDEMYSSARKIQQKYGVSDEVVDYMVAQWCMESANGQSELAKATGNIGGLTQSGYTPFPQPASDGSAFYKTYNSTDEYAEDYFLHYLKNRADEKGVDLSKTKDLSEFVYVLQGSETMNYSTISEQDYFNATKSAYDNIANERDAHKSYQLEVPEFENFEYAPKPQQGVGDNLKQVVNDFSDIVPNEMDLMGYSKGEQAALNNPSLYGEVMDEVSLPSQEELDNDSFGTKFGDTFVANVFDNTLNETIRTTMANAMSPQQLEYNDDWSINKYEPSDFDRNEALLQLDGNEDTLNHIINNSTNQKAFWNLVRGHKDTMARRKRAEKRSTGLHSSGALAGMMVDPLNAVPMLGEAVVAAKFGARPAVHMIERAFYNGLINTVDRDAMGEVTGDRQSAAISFAEGMAASIGLESLAKLAAKGFKMGANSKQVKGMLQRSIRWASEQLAGVQPLEKAFEVAMPDLQLKGGVSNINDALKIAAEKGKGSKPFKAMKGFITEQTGIQFSNREFTKWLELYNDRGGRITEDIINAHSLAEQGVLKKSNLQPIKNKNGVVQVDLGVTDVKPSKKEIKEKTPAFIHEDATGNKYEINYDGEILTKNNEPLVRQRKNRNGKRKIAVSKNGRKYEKSDKQGAILYAGGRNRVIKEYSKIPEEILEWKTTRRCVDNNAAKIEVTFTNEDGHSINWNTERGLYFPEGTERFAFGKYFDTGEFALKHVIDADRVTEETIVKDVITEGSRKDLEAKIDKVEGELDAVVKDFTEGKTESKLTKEEMDTIISEAYDEILEAKSKVEGASSEAESKAALEKLEKMGDNIAKTIRSKADKLVEDKGDVVLNNPSPESEMDMYLENLEAMDKSFEEIFAEVVDASIVIPHRLKGKFGKAKPLPREVQIQEGRKALEFADYHKEMTENIDDIYEPLSPDEGLGGATSYTPDEVTQMVNAELPKWLRPIAKAVTTSYLFGDQYSRMAHSLSGTVQDFGAKLMINPRQSFSEITERMQGVVIEPIIKSVKSEFAPNINAVMNGFNKHVSIAGASREARQNYGRQVMDYYHAVYRDGAKVEDVPEHIVQAAKGVDVLRKQLVDFAKTIGLLKDDAKFLEPNELWRYINKEKIEVLKGKFPSREAFIKELTKYAYLNGKWELLAPKGDVSKLAPKEMHASCEEWATSLWDNSAETGMMHFERELNMFKRRLPMDTSAKLEIMTKDGAYEFSFDDDLREFDIIGITNRVSKQMAAHVAFATNGIKDPVKWANIQINNAKLELNHAESEGYLHKEDVEDELSFMSDVFTQVTGLGLDPSHLPKPPSIWKRISEIVRSFVYAQVGFNMGMSNIPEAFMSLAVNGSQAIFHYAPPLHRLFNDSYGKGLVTGDQLQAIKAMHIAVEYVDHNLDAQRCSSLEMDLRAGSTTHNVLGKIGDMTSKAANVTSKLSQVGNITDFGSRACQVDVVRDLILWSNGEFTSKSRQDIFDERSMKIAGIQDVAKFKADVKKYIGTLDPKADNAVVDGFARWKKDDFITYYGMQSLTTHLAEQAIITSTVGNRALYADSAIVPIVLQFREFSRKTINAHLFRTLGNAKMRHLNGYLGAAIGAGAMWATKVYINAWSKYPSDEEKRNAYLEKRLTYTNMFNAGLWRAGAGTALAWIYDGYAALTGAENFHNTKAAYGETSGLSGVPTNIVSQIPAVHSASTIDNAVSSVGEIFTSGEVGRKQAQAFLDLYPIDNFAPLAIMFGTIKDQLQGDSGFSGGGSASSSGGFTRYNRRKRKRRRNY